MLKKTTPYVILIASLSLSASSVLSGANILWTNSDGGDFGAPENWSAGVPGAADRADIRAGGEYTIHLDEDRTIGQLRMDEHSSASQVTLDLGGYTLISTSNTPANAALFLQGTDTTVRSLKLINGKMEAYLSRIGHTTGLGGELIVGEGATYQMQAGGDTHRVGSSGIGKLRVEGTGHLILGDGASFSVAAIGNPEGYVHVTGPQARFSATDRDSGFYIGNAAGGIAEMQITNAAEANIEGIVNVGQTAGGSGRLEVSYDAKLVVGRTLRIGNSGTGHVLFSSGAHANISRIDINGSSTLEINAATVVSTHSNPNNWLAGSTYRVFLNAADATPLSIHSIHLDSTLDVQLGAGFEAVLGNYYTLIDYTGVIDGSFRDANGDALADGDQITIGDYVFELNYGNKTTGGVIALELVAIPEPGSTALGFAAAVLLISLVWRKRRYR